MMIQVKSHLRKTKRKTSQVRRHIRSHKKFSPVSNKKQKWIELGTDVRKIEEYLDKIKRNIESLTSERKLCEKISGLLSKLRGDAYHHPEQILTDMEYIDDKINLLHSKLFPSKLSDVTEKMRKDLNRLRKIVEVKYK